MTDKEVSRYLELVERRLFILTHSGVDWQPEYGPELVRIDQELAKLRKVVDAEHERRDQGVSKQFMNAEEVAEIMGYSVRQGYKVIQELNAELKAQGYIIRAGRVPRKYFYERTGLDQEEVGA